MVKCLTEQRVPLIRKWVTSRRLIPSSLGPFSFRVVSYGCLQYLSERKRRNRTLHPMTMMNRKTETQTHSWRAYRNALQRSATRHIRPNTIHRRRSCSLFLALSATRLASGPWASGQLPGIFRFIGPGKDGLRDS